jgi:hypothetical protein
MFEKWKTNVEIIGSKAKWLSINRQMIGEAIYIRVSDSRLY